LEVEPKIELIVMKNGKKIGTIPMGRPTQSRFYKHERLWYKSKAVAPYFFHVTATQVIIPERLDDGDRSLDGSRDLGD